MIDRKLNREADTHTQMADFQLVFHLNFFMFHLNESVRI